MDWSQLKRRLAPVGSTRTALFTLPPIIFELEPDFVLGARLGNGSATSLVRNIAVAGLEARPIEPSAHRSNIVNPAALARGLRAVSEAVGNGTSRLGLLVPDGTVRVGILDFETLPESREETETLMRWRMKDSLPFPPDEVRLSYQVLRQQDKSLECLVVAGRGSVFSEYESALDEMSGEPALILPATAALLPLVPREEAGLLIHLCSGWVTLVVVDADRVRLWRTRELAETEPQQLSQEVVSEVVRVLAAVRDRVQVEIGRAWLCARPPAPPALAVGLTALIGREVEPLRLDPGLAGALPVQQRALFEGYGAPLAGLVANASAG